MGPGVGKDLANQNWAVRQSVDNCNQEVGGGKEKILGRELKSLWEEEADGIVRSLGWKGWIKGKEGI